MAQDEVRPVVVATSSRTIRTAAANHHSAKTRPSSADSANGCWPHW